MTVRNLLLIGFGTILLLGLLLIAGALYNNNATLMREPGPWARLQLYLGNNVAQTGQGQRLPELSPIVLRGQTGELLDAVAQALQQLQWREIEIDHKQATVRAVVTSPLWKFSDDINVTLLARAEGLMEASVRASSRVGRGDLGANANHIMQLREVLKEQGLVQSDAP